MKQSTLKTTLFLCLLLVAGCGSIEIKSRWRTRDVVIDGKNTEWRYMTLLDDKATAVGMLNDGDFLYLVLTTSNHDVSSQILRRGITFWFDKEGGKSRKFGVHYPVGSGGFRASQQDEKAEAKETEPASRSEITGEEVDILGPGENDRHRMTLAETGGIDAKLHSSNDFLVYEMKVPLADNGLRPFAVGTKAGMEIGVGAETSNERMSQRPSEGFSGGGEGGGRSGGGTGGGGMGGRGGGRRGGGGRSGGGGQAEPFSMWAKVQLSVNDSLAH